ncbi:imidazole glycerol phosphate synthase subunit HisH [Caenispirillum salinarum]|uniref:imidazole glycerol phosphate synthase subunit HisH n=1 Tax=Caenispirillum salinarum TaxID=859058 RepID=UPI003850A7FE
MTVAIIDYGSGNLRSAAKALERAVAESGSTQSVLVTADTQAVREADRIVLPGVGAFADCRRGLDAVPGMVDALRETVLEKGRPFLGICVGMQLMATKGLEHRTADGLDWISGEVVRIHPRDPALKVPHMGWNELVFDPGAHPMFDGITPGDHAYFVHSYHYVPHDPAHRLATVEYGETLTACVGRDNLFGTQFHPEKSQATGLKLLSNFLRWAP